MSDCRSFPCSKVIGRAGGTLTVGTFKLTVPANAVSSNTTFTVNKHAAPRVVGLTERSAVYELSPHGVDFSRDVNIDVPYTPLSATARMHFSMDRYATIVDPLGWQPNPESDQKIDGHGNFDNCNTNTFNRYFVLVGE
jgi:ZU5 domain